jgi:hypothetical protein
LQPLQLLLAVWVRARPGGPAPSDSFLFGFIKEKFIEYDIADGQSLNRAITHICDEIGQETLIAVFETWVNRLECVI